MSDLPKAIWEGSFKVLGVEVKCFTLDDGTRIIEAESFHNLMDAMGRPHLNEEERGDMQSLLRWQRGGLH